jgi:hypothetical protein
MRYYSLSGESAYLLLTGELYVSISGANLLLDTAQEFEEVRVWLERQRKILAVSFKDGYFNLEVT